MDPNVHHDTEDELAGPRVSDNTGDLLDDSLGSKGPEAPAQAAPTAESRDEAGVTSEVDMELTEGPGFASTPKSGTVNAGDCSDGSDSESESELDRTNASQHDLTVVQTEQRDPLVEFAANAMLSSATPRL
jgi:hypothetical protein